MAKKNLKRGLALGALMAFVITGSAMAREIGAGENAEVMSRLEIGQNVSHEPIDNKLFNGLGNGKLQGGAIYVKEEGSLTVTNSDFVGNRVNGTGRASGAAIYNNNGTVNIENCYFKDNVADGTKSAYGSVIGTTGKSGITSIKNSLFEGNNGGTSNGLIYAANGSSVILENNVFSNNNKTCVNIEAGSKVTFKGTENKILDNDNRAIIVKGNLIFDKNSNTEISGTNGGILIGADANIKLAEGSSLVAETGMNIDGNNNKKNGTVTFGEGSNLGIGSNSYIPTVAGEGGTFKFLDGVDVKVNNNTTKNLTFAASGKANDAVGGDASKLIENFNLNGSENTKMVLEEGKIQGEKVVDLNIVKDDKGNYSVEGAKVLSEAVNTKSDAVSDAGMTLKAHYRAHMNDMNKRMGELRMANGEAGVWTRMVRGESEYQGAKMQYNQYQLGYDEKLSVDKRWTVGAAVTFSEGDASYGQGSTEDKSTAFAIYGSKLNNDGTFVDLIARYAHLESDLDDRVYGAGNYSTNGMSVSAEFGKRIQQGNGLWIEPQVELTYGSVDGASVTFADGNTANYDSIDSFIARAGFALGKDIKQGNVYARASYLYDFDGETATQFEGGKAITEDFGGGWWEVGVGANINLSKATYIYADVEKTFGGEVDTNWQWNLGVRYSF